MSVCCVLSGRGLCDRPIPRPEESYRVCHSAHKTITSTPTMSRLTYVKAKKEIKSVRKSMNFHRLPKVKRNQEASVQPRDLPVNYMANLDEI
jgi:hypothetical protein